MKLRKIVDHYIKLFGCEQMNRIVKKIQNKLIVFKNEKKFIKDNDCFKYMLLENQHSDDLIVVFSSCTKIGVRAQYHYIQTLRGVRANKLFILDDKASDHRGGYYIGANMAFNEENVVRTLIQECARKVNAKRLIFVGSSKGAYAALNYGIEWDSSIIIVGAPQYYLGDYLNNIEGEKTTLKYIVGSDIRADKILFLNNRLKNKVLKNARQNQRIYFHYSEKEETYGAQILPLLNDLKSTKIQLFCDIGDYSMHSEVGKNYQKFLLSTVNEL